MRVELRGVKKAFNGKMVVDIDSLLLESGRIYAVLGANGSGKTTTLRIVASIDSDYSGSVLYNGINKLRAVDMAYMPQSTYMFDLTVRQNVILGLKNLRISNTEMDARSKSALDCVGMGDFLNSRARSLSGGEAQRVALARTLVLGKKLVLLDEPASATDILGIELVERYIKGVNEKDGTTIVFTTHNPSQAARIADEVVMMHNGRVVEMGSPSSVFSSPRRQETREFIKNWKI